MAALVLRTGEHKPTEREEFGEDGECWAIDGNEREIAAREMVLDLLAY
jgi:hypothetical protein